MEETIGYEALFSSTEWNAIVTGDWSLLDDDEFGDRISSGAATAGPGSAAQESAAASEVPPRHKVTVTVVDDCYELTCDACDFWDHLSDVRNADNLKRLHEEFVATRVGRYEV